MIVKGSLVTPKTEAGLCLGDVPSNGEYGQKVNTACVFQGKGVVLETRAIIIDYDSWPDGTDENNPGVSYANVGKVKYRNCLVKCDAGVGWAGEGALVKTGQVEYVTDLNKNKKKPRKKKNV